MTEKQTAKREVRWHLTYGANHWMRWQPVRFMTEAEGWVMVRHKGCMPFLIAKKEWDGYERTQPAEQAA